MEENILGKNIKYMRQQYGETGEELGFALNMTKSAINGYESGRRKPEPEILKRICKHYGKTIDEMLNAKLYELEGIDSTKIVDLDDMFKLFMYVLPLIESEEAYENASFSKGMKIAKEMLALKEVDVFDGVKYFTEASEEGIYEASANILWYIFLLWTLPCTDIDSQKKFQSRLLLKQVDWKEMTYEIKKNKKKSAAGQLAFVENYDELINKLIKKLKDMAQWAPLGDYYLALKYMLGMVDTGETDEMNQTVGVQMMISFAQLDNRYAKDFLKAVVEMQ